MLSFCLVAEGFSLGCEAQSRQSKILPMTMRIAQKGGPSRAGAVLGPPCTLVPQDGTMSIENAKEGVSAIGPKIKTSPRNSPLPSIRCAGDIKSLSSKSLALAPYRGPHIEVARRYQGICLADRCIRHPWSHGIVHGHG
jgi:hypothetical protein